MASMIPSSSHEKPFLIEKRPLMLKDYLTDDLSSCSSNGFKSFPRRQCCTTVRFLLEIDLNTNPKNQRRQFFKRTTSSKAASTTISALQKASEAVINAVKLLPFPSSSTKSSFPFLHSRTRKGGLLPRSLSRKLFKKSSRKKEDHREREGSEIRRFRSFRDFLEERDEPSDHKTVQNYASPVANVCRLSTSSGSNSQSWTDSEFTVDSGNSESYSSQNAVAGGQIDLPSEKKVSEAVGATSGEDSMAFSVEKNAKEWPNEEEKEQFSPVSVLDCPFQDEEDTNCSPFQRSLVRMEGVCSLVRMEGAKQKFMAKIRRFERLAELDPLNLEKQMALAVEEDELLKSPSSLSLQNDVEEERGPHQLLKLAKATIPSNHRLTSNADTILLDFFREKIMENRANGNLSEGPKSDLKKEIEEAQDWINGYPEEMFIGSEVKDTRAVCVRDMERKGKWKNFDEEKEELVLALEIEVFNALVKEAMLDLPS